MGHDKWSTLVRVERHSLASTLPRIGKLFGAAILAGALVAVIALPAVGGVGIAARGGAGTFQDMPEDLKPPPLPERSRILAADGTRIATFYTQNRIAVPMKKIAPAMRKAMVAIEDSRFYQHDGIDMEGMARAMAINFRSGSIRQGGSTLTQQYVENVLVLKADTEEAQADARAQSVEGKLQEIRYALELEKDHTKKQILNGYLNIAYFGEGAYGVEAASRHYFSKHASKLTIAQAALLAGIVRSPGALDPTDHPKAAKRRRNVVISRMAQLGKITGQQAKKAKDTGLTLDVNPTDNGCTDSQVPFFCKYVMKEIMLSKQFGKTEEERAKLIQQGGLTIHTTLDLQAQKAARRALRNHVPPKKSDHKAAAEAMVEPGTGEVKALAVSLPYGQGKHQTTVNLAANYAHGGNNGAQAGSSFKPFTLATALAQGMPFSKTIYSPYELHPNQFQDCQGNPIYPNGWTPNNFSSSENGPYNLKKGTWKSVNTFYVQLQNQVGLCNVVKTARKLGLRKANGEPLPDSVASFTLGVVNVAPLDMAAAYATFAARGKYCDPIAITKVVDSNGNTLDVPKPNCKQVLKPGVADGVSYVLKGVLNQGTAVSSDIPRPAAGKTGTTNGPSAAWFAGYTPKLASAVWVGDPRGGANHPLKDVVIGGRYFDEVQGASLPAPIWQQSMTGALKGTPPSSFKTPPGWMFYVPKPDPPKKDKDGGGHGNGGNNGGGNNGGGNNGGGNNGGGNGGGGNGNDDDFDNPLPRPGEPGDGGPRVPPPPDAGPPGGPPGRED